MLNFYHGKRILPKSDDEIYSSCYEYYKINKDTQLDIYHLLIKFDNFLALFERVCVPSDKGVYLVKDQEEYQNKVFYKNGKPLLNIDGVSESLSVCSIIISDIANFYSSLTENNLRITTSALRGLFDEKYKQQTVKYYLNGDMKDGKKVELDSLLDQLKNNNSYQQLFFDPFFEVIVNGKSNQIDLSYGASQNVIASFSLKGIGSLLYDLLSSIHHRNIHSFRNLEIREGDDDYKKRLTDPLNILYEFICVEILGLVFSFSQEHINEKKLQDLAPLASLGSDEPEMINLRRKVNNLCLSYRFLNNLHEKVLENYRGNLQKYLIQLKCPYRALIE